MSQKKSAVTLAGSKLSSDPPSLSPTPFRRRPREAHRNTALIWYSLYRAEPRSNSHRRTPPFAFQGACFQADLKLNAAFDLSGVPFAAPLGAVLDWSQAELLVGVRDARGALADATFTAAGKTDSFVPTDIFEDYRSIRTAIKPSVHHSRSLELSPLNSLSPTHSLTCPPHCASPERNGSPFLPTERPRTSPWKAIGPAPASMADSFPSPAPSPQGFSAEWSVPLIARGIPAEGPSSSSPASIQRTRRLICRTR